MSLGQIDLVYDNIRKEEGSKWAKSNGRKEMFLYSDMLVVTSVTCHDFSPLFC